MTGKRLAQGAVSLMILLAGCSTSVPNKGHEHPPRPAIPTPAQTRDNGNVASSLGRQRADVFRKRFQARLDVDRKVFTQQEFRAIENLYQRQPQDANERKEQLKSLVSKYPKANRAGCAVQYLGQMSEGAEREYYFRMAMNKYGDCWYGDGVQVGAYARYYLAWHYHNLGRTAETAALCQELLADFPDAITHRGDLLIDKLPPVAGDAAPSARADDKTGNELSKSSKPRGEP